MPIAARRSLQALLTALAMLAVTTWFVIFAYADWLRFSSPPTPNPATGQVIYEKAVKGVFYITQGQAFWVQKTLLPAWLLLATAGLLRWLITPKGERRTPSHPAWTATTVLYMIAMFAVMWFGDRLLAPLFEAVSPYVR